VLQRLNSICRLFLATKEVDFRVANSMGVVDFETLNNLPPSDNPRVATLHDP
jgi:hypothetical protein